MLTEFVVNLGLETITAEGLTYIEKVKIENALKEFLEKKKVHFDVSTKEEEVDFENLRVFIVKQLRNDVITRILGMDPKMRGDCRDLIVKEAIKYANAKTSISEERVRRIVYDSLDILRKFFYLNLPADLRRTVFMIVENMESIATKQTQQIKNHVDQASHKSAQLVIEAMDSRYPMSIEQGIRSVKDGKLHDASNNLDSYVKSISTAHPLYPDYGFSPVNSGTQFIFLSVPLTDEASYKHPSKLICDGIVRIGEQIINEPSTDVFRRANQLQAPITISVTNAYKVIGKIMDPQQFEAQDLVGKDLVIPPDPFPEAISCGMKIDELIIVPYTLIRTKQIVEEKIYVLTNEEHQHRLFDFTIKVNSDNKKVDFTVSLISGKVKDYLAYKRFLSSIAQGKQLCIYELSSNTELIRGNLAAYGDVASLNKEIEFMEKLVRIEGYFNTEISIPEVITHNDYELVEYLYTLISGDEAQGKWTSLNLTLTLSDSTRDNLIDIGSNKHSISYSANTSISLFGNAFNVFLKRTFSSLVIDNFDSVEKKLEVLESGDVLKLTCVPSDDQQNSTYIDTLESHDEPMRIEYEN